MEKLISIITPVYNSERWLDKCINSVQSQTYKNFELILVNDGSTDNSGEICNKYADKDDRIKVIHTINQGVSSARNQGLELARGDYICFLDSDDAFKENLCEIISNTFDKNDIDIIIFGYENTSKEQILPSFNNGKIENLIKDLDKYKKLNTNYDFCFSCRYSFKRLFLKSINNVFDKDISMGEDTLFNMKAIFESNSIYVLKQSLYIYNDLNINSTVRKKYKPNLPQIFNENYIKKIKIINNYKIKSSNFFYDFYYYHIYLITVNIIKNSFNGPKENILDDINYVLNTDMCIESFKYFNLKELYKISDNICFYFFLCMCKFKLSKSIYLYSKLFFKW